ncbi:MAG: STAS domain-containing protein [Planctomycetales bacterium]|nr:STAS domain-containing protein [Planctomycetales bacterium]
MAQPTGFLEAARAEDAVYVRVVGHGNFTLAGPFREFAEAMLAEGGRKFVVDLSGCVGLDSTFMGTLAAIAGAAGERADGWVQAVNPTDHARRLLAELGVARLLRVRDDPVKMPDLSVRRIEPRLGSPVERLKTAADAHRALIRVDPANEKKFHAVLGLLDRELEGLRKQGKS